MPSESKKTRQELLKELETARRTIEEQAGSLEEIKSFSREMEAIGKVGGWEIDTRAGKLWWSQGLYVLLELDPEKVDADFEAYLAAVHPEDREKVEQAHAGALETSSPYDIEHRFLFPDGRVKWVRARCRKEHGPEEKHLRSIGTVQDITDFKRAEESLQEDRCFWESVVDNLPLMVFVKDAEDLRFVRFNRAGEELLGFPREEMLGKNDFDFFPGEEAAFFASKDREVLRAGKLVDIPEESIHTKHQGERILHTKKIPILADDGTPLYLLGISEDITRRKMAEEQLAKHRSRLEELVQEKTRALSLALEAREREIKERELAQKALERSDKLHRNFIMHSLSGAWWYEVKPPMPIDLPVEEQVEWLFRNAVLEECSAEYARMYGFSHPSEMVGRRFIDFLGGNEQVAREIIWLLIENDYTFPSTENMQTTLQGDEIWSIVSGAGVIEDNELIRVWGTQLDITERKRSEEERQVNQRQMEAMSRAVGDALIMIDGHDKVHFWNPAAEKLFGYTAREAMGMEFHAMAVGPELAAKAKAGLKNFRESGQGPVFGHTVELVTHDRGGREFPVEVTLSPFQVDDKWYAVGTVRDITDRKKIGDAVQAKSEQFSRLISAMPDAVAQMDLQGRFTYLSPNVKEVYGIDDLSQKVGTTALQWIHPDYHEKAKSRIARMVGGDEEMEAETVEYLLCRQDGSTFWGAIKSSILRDENGSPTGMITVTRDISESKEAEKELLVSRSRLEMALNASNTGLWEWRPQDDEHYCNKQYFRQLGYGQDEFPDHKNLTARLLHPDDLGGFKNAMQDCLSGKCEEFRQEFRMKAKNGAWKWILSLGRVWERDHSGRVQKMIGVHLDMTERRHWEDIQARERKRLQEILDTSPVGIAIVTDGRFRMVNPRLHEMLGATVGEEAKSLYVHPEERDAIVKLVAQKGLVENYEIELYDRDRRVRNMLVTYLPVIHEGRKGVMTWSIDMTERKKAEEKLRRNFDQLERFSRLTVGREKRMITLKEEINELLKELGRSEKYKIFGRTGGQ